MLLRFKQFLLEYLTDKQRELYKYIKMSPEARRNTDHFFGKDNDHVREDLIGHTPDKSEVHKAVERHLGQEIDHDSYKAGKIKDKHGRDARLGRMIKDKELVHEFSQDNTRAGSRKIEKPYVTIVRGTEVAGQTNSAPNKEHPSGHSWKSCKNVGYSRGIDCYKVNELVKNDIKSGAVVVRYHNHDGEEIHRATLYPGKNDKGHVAYFTDISGKSQLGIQHPSFNKHTENVAKRLSGEHKGGSLIYDVSGVRQIHNVHLSATSEDIEKLLNHKKSDVRMAAIRHPNSTSEHIHKALNDIKIGVRHTAIQNVNSTSEHIHKALEDRHVAVRKAAAGHPNATLEHIDRALGDEHGHVRHAAAGNPNATPEHIDRALGDKEWYVRETAAKHPNAPK
jgi:hypothetical protein